MSNSAGCRILVVSATTAQAQQFVQRVKAISNIKQGQPEDLITSTNATDVASTSIPWTIENKYYTADVHFETRELHTFIGYHASEVPAVVYVWSRGDPYKDHVPSLAQKLQHYDPEVSLAVRLSHGNSQVLTYARDEEDALDEFLSSHGFEYVDGDRGGRLPTGDGGSFSDEASSGAPGLPRVVDALSTIMWPSLVQFTATTTRKSRARELLDWARQEEEDDGLRALVSSPDSEVAGADDERKKSRMQREMDELERWLEQEDPVGRHSATDDAEAWGTARHDRGGDSEGWADIPTPLVQTPNASDTFGFEDDFAEFVGAPLHVSYDDDRKRRGTNSTSDALAAHHTGASYRSLASASDFGGDDVLGLDGEDDADLPSRAEIEETSKRIFGLSLDAPSPPPKQSSSHDHEHDISVLSDSSPEHDTERTDIHYQPLDDDSFAGPSTDDEEFEFGAFDLPRVLGALQNMKEEIAGMNDESERRRAAARVALGLVYGLQKEEEREQEVT